MGDDCENVRAAGSVDGSWERGGEAIYSRRDTAAGGCKRFDRFASKLGDRFALYIVGVRPGQAGPVRVRTPESYSRGSAFSDSTVILFVRRLLAPPLRSIFIPLFGDPYITRTASCTYDNTTTGRSLGLASKVTRNLLESLVDKLGASGGAPFAPYIFRNQTLS
jgi:hypothetical protein